MVYAYLFILHIKIYKSNNCDVIRVKQRSHDQEQTNQKSSFRWPEEVWWTSVTLVRQDLVFISRRTESGDGDDRGGYDGSSDCVRSNDGPDRCGDITGGAWFRRRWCGCRWGSGLGWDWWWCLLLWQNCRWFCQCDRLWSVCSGKNCPRGTNGFAKTKRRMQSSLKLWFEIKS